MAVKVKDVMGKVAIAARMDASFSDLVGIMQRYKVGAVTVIDADRRPVGVVSEDDLLLKETSRPGPWVIQGPKRWAEHRKAAGLTAHDFMSSPAITVTGETTVGEAARLMHHNRIKQLPVVDPATGRITGTVHQRDLLKVFNRPAEDIGGEIEAIARRLDVDPAELRVAVESGVVSLKGWLPRHSQLAPLLEAVRGVDGVVDIRADLAFLFDDLLVPPPLL
ncbi:CBS domain-containing protein [Planotetraspora thailandica]|nr:CBS domain-containing protein [Planotetraspora thailandica]